MWRAALLSLIALCGACSPNQESVRTVAAVEIPLRTATDRVDLVAILQRHANTNGLHVDDVTGRWRDAEAQLNTVTPAARGTLFVGVWRGTKDEEFVADADDSGHPGRAWVTFVKGQHQSEATSFREAVIADLKKRFPDALALPVLPSGGLPLSDDLRLTSAGYKIARRAAADYGLPPSSPLLAENE